MIYRATTYIYGSNRSIFNKLNLSFSFKKKREKKRTTRITTNKNGKEQQQLKTSTLYLQFFDLFIYFI